MEYVLTPEYDMRATRSGAIPWKKCANRTISKNRTCAFRGSTWTARRGCTTTRLGSMIRMWGGLPRRTRLGWRVGSIFISMRRMRRGGLIRGASQGTGTLLGCQHDKAIKDTISFHMSSEIIRSCKEQTAISTVRQT